MAEHVSLFMQIICDEERSYITLKRERESECYIFSLLIVTGLSNICDKRKLPTLSTLLPNSTGRLLDQPEDTCHVQTS
jgi:hypothetical protein